MKTARTYLHLDGNEIPFDNLDAGERRLLERIRRRARTHPDWCDFDGFWLREVAAFYDSRGLSRAKARRTVVYRIAQDLGNRLGIAGGFIRAADEPAPRHKKTG
jgi:hypothetical protein